MPYAFLAVTVVGAVAVALAYRPIRREPLTIVSFAWPGSPSELALQNIVWQMVATALFIAFGALDGLGRVARPGASPSPAGSAWWAWASPGLRAADVTAAALAEVRSDAFPVPTERTAADLGPLVARHPRPSP